MGKSIICLGRGGLGKAFEEHGVRCYDRKEIDINDICDLNSLFNSERPVYVINCAGIVGTGKCENNPEMAYMVNVGGVSNIAYACKKYNVTLIHISTIYVGNYNVYTRSKLLAEQVINESTVSNTIIRLPWLFGFNTDNFILSAIKGKEVSIYENEYGYLAYDNDIVEYIIDNIGNIKGTISVGNKGRLDRKIILNFIKSKYKTIKRETDMPIECPKLTTELRSWEEAMEDFINGIRSM